MRRVLWPFMQDSRPPTEDEWVPLVLQRHLTYNKALQRAIRHARYFTLQLAESHLTWSFFRQILQRIEPLAWHPT
jgi:hypothetical protein